MSKKASNPSPPDRSQRPAPPPGPPRRASRRTLDQIVSAVRLGEPVSNQELREAVVAFDVLMSDALDIAGQRLVAPYAKAAEAVPADYLGSANHPDSAEAREWYRAMHGVAG